MAIPFLSGEDTRMRLDRTICMYKGKPYHVSANGDSATFIYLTTLSGRGNGDYTEIKVTDPLFCYKAPLLGYMQYGNMAYYVMRIPLRQQKAGISKDCLITEPALPAGNYFATSSFEKCILGKHTKYQTALEQVQSGKFHSVPIHRYVAIGISDGSQSIGLYYRTRLVGMQSPHTGRFQLIDGPDTSFVQRILDNLKLGVFE